MSKNRTKQNIHSLKREERRSSGDSNVRTIERPKQKTHLILKTLYQRVVFRSSDFLLFSCMYENVCRDA